MSKRPIATFLAGVAVGAAGCWLALDAPPPLPAHPDTRITAPLPPATVKPRPARTRATKHA